MKFFLQVKIYELLVQTSSTLIYLKKIIRKV